MSYPGLRAMFRPCNLRARQCAFTRTPKTAFRSFTSSAFLRNEERDKPRPRLSERIQQRIPESIRNKLPDTIRENIYTIPNALTMSRIIACPFLGWAIVESNFTVATALLAYAGLTDLADGWIARRFKMNSVLGTILDPAADKTLMTTLTVTLAVQGCLPVPLAVIIVGRDVLLSLSAFWIRYTSLPAPKTFSRYWDFSIPSAEVNPTGISKVNTALQLLLMGSTTVAQILPAIIGIIDMNVFLTGFQWLVGSTTIASGLSYIFSSTAVRIIRPKDKQP
ncbi:hypothetical protein CYLTODRAFT_370758 [Cylindrobasidium torrendii FP15055 ss-10]|uniref:CDP-alcohol phosphatidyltransferase n=1 Tax=Cylindrobasidium torrendii FP15055 ss-10 TaxID=1314674 RepID=A0A0D7BKA4_9AGAR|nr:hypothetical protein CYLTODRAFT_370758 [Cylindrobasidium torrendii FP15055 ss-10]